MAATTDKLSLEGQQLSKLEKNLRRFEDERRKFELERRKFEVERRELDRIRLKRIEERDKKRIAEGYQQLLTIRSSSDKSRKASLKASGDPEEKQRLIESFNEAQEMSSLPQEKKTRKSSSKAKKHLQPPDLVPPSTVRRSVSLRRRASPRPLNDHSTSEDADDEYATERKGSSGISMQQRALANSKFVAESEEKSVEVEEKKPRTNWFLKLFKKSPPTTAPKELESKKEKVAAKKTKMKKNAERSKWKSFKERNQKDVLELRRLAKKCIADTIILAILCGFGGLIFRFTEGAVENFYKCGVKKVKRDFVDQLWTSSHNMRFLFNLCFAFTQTFMFHVNSSNFTAGRMIGNQWLGIR